MKKLLENKYFVAFFMGIVTAVIGIILYPLFDILICKFITKSVFEYSVTKHIIEPTIFGFAMGIILYFPFNKNKK